MKSTLERVLVLKKDRRVEKEFQCLEVLDSNAGRNELVRFFEVDIL